LTADERRQIETQLSAAFGLTAEAAETWVETTARRGTCFGRVENDGMIAASYAAEPLALVRGDERLTAVMLQSCYVHPSFRGRGYGLDRSDVDALRRRYTAEAVVLTLFDDGLVPYWRRRGFEVVQRNEIVGLDEYARRAGTAFSPALTEQAGAAKIAEVTADGANITELDLAAGGGAPSDLVLVRYAGDDLVDELFARGRVQSSGTAAAAFAGGSPQAMLRVRLKTVMASPPGLDLVCAIDL